MCFVLSFFGQRIIEPLDSSLVKHVIAEVTKLSTGQRNVEKEINGGKRQPRIEMEFKALWKKKTKLSTGLQSRADTYINMVTVAIRDTSGFQAPDSQKICLISSSFLCFKHMATLIITRYMMNHPVSDLIYGVYSDYFFHISNIILIACQSVPLVNR